MAVIGSSQPLESALLRAVRPILAGHARRPARQQRRDAVPSLWALVTQLGSGGSCLAALLLRLLLAGEQEPAGVTWDVVQRMGVPDLLFDAALQSARAHCASLVDGRLGGTSNLSTPRRPSRPALCICSLAPVGQSSCTAPTEGRKTAQSCVPPQILLRLDWTLCTTITRHYEDPARPSARPLRQGRNSCSVSVGEIPILVPQSRAVESVWSPRRSTPDGDRPLTSPWWRTRATCHWQPEGEDARTGDRSGGRKVSSTTHPRQRSRNPTLSRLDVQAPPGR